MFDVYGELKKQFYELLSKQMSKQFVLLILKLVRFVDQNKCISDNSTLDHISQVDTLIKETSRIRSYIYPI